MSEDEDFMKKFEKIDVLQRCPKCGKISLMYKEGKLECANCTYSHDVGTIE